MTCEVDFLPAQLVCEGDDIGREFWNGVRSDAARLAAQIVATLIGNDDAESCGSQRLDLRTPSVPEFRKAVEKHNDETVFRTSGHGVQTQI